MNESLDVDSELIIVLITFLIGLPLMWVLISYIASQEGWSELAKLYRCYKKPEGTFRSFRSIRFGFGTYGNCVTIGFCDEGFYLALTLPFVFFHPPLLIRWEQFHSTHKKRILFWYGKTTYIGTPIMTQLNLPAYVYDELIERESQIALVEEA